MGKPMSGDSTREELEQAILNDAADGVQRTSTDGSEVEMMDLADRIKVADRAKNRSAAARGHFGMRFTRLIPPGGGGQT